MTKKYFFHNFDNMTRNIVYNIKNFSSTNSLLRKITGFLYHPWYYGLSIKDPFKLKTRSCFPFEQDDSMVDLPGPILFLARGHSGTTPLTKILIKAGIFMGDVQNKYSLNHTLDALYWVFGFQRTLLPKLFKPGIGSLIDENLARLVATECLSHHLKSYSNGLWGFKTCAGMFCHSLYQYIFPRAKYIYLVRDGRDVILSGNGYFHLTHPFSRYQHWEYFKIITFGISNDLHKCPFVFPGTPQKNDLVIKNRFWTQAKSWREHVRMVEHLQERKELSPNVHFIRYEELCQNPIPVLERLFNFLQVELTEETKNFAMQNLYTHSIGKWKHYHRYISDYEENMEMVFATMKPELERLGYPQ